ncbi:MAG: hypothetical protein OXI57_02790 [Rhodospirillales bacterium]|nr:hypothetical protein [Rhodospirillales bacterium]
MSPSPISLLFDEQSLHPEADRSPPLAGCGGRSLVPPQMRANWKVAADNFLECFHCRNAHPMFSQTLDVSRTAAGANSARNLRPPNS